MASQDVIKADRTYTINEYRECAHNPTARTHQGEAYSNEKQDINANLAKRDSRFCWSHRTLLQSPGRCCCHQTFLRRSWWLFLPLLP